MTPLFRTAFLNIHGRESSSAGILATIYVGMLCLSAQLADGHAIPVSGHESDPIVGLLVDSQGKPLAGVKMCLCSRRLMVWEPELPVEDPANPDGCVFSTTDNVGRFSFPLQQQDCTLLVFTDAGYVIAKSKRFTFPLTVRLTPWARLQGVAKIGDRPAPSGIQVKAWYHNDEMDGELGPWPYFVARTDVQGRFDFGRVLVGNYAVYRIISEGSEGEVNGIAAAVTADAGKVTESVVPFFVGQDVHGAVILPKVVDPLGGSGVAWTTDSFLPSINLSERRWLANGQIVQRIELSRLTLPADVLRMTSEQRLAWYNDWEAHSADGQRHAAQMKLARSQEEHHFVRIHPDGTFFAADVRSGTHTLRATFFPLVKDRIDYDHPLTDAAYDFAVAAVDDSLRTTRLELGVLAPRPTQTISADQIAPDITFRDREGPDILLSGLRGKVVFLDFWGVWCGGCQHDLPNVKAIYKAYGSNPHFAMVSLDVGDKRNTWETFVQKNQMVWPQGFLGEFDAAWQARAFCTSGCPSYWVLGPDGRVLAQGYRSNSLRAIIEQALADVK